MPNALDKGGPPPAPMPAQGAPQPGGAPQAVPAQQQIPAPTFGQTVATLRHMHEIQDELEKLLKLPDVGKSSIKKQIIDGATELVARRIITPAQAVQQLGTVPDDPLEQRKWLRQQLAQSVTAQNAVLDHHRAANQGPVDPERDTYDPEAHMDTMAAVNDHYKGLRRG